MAQLKSVEKNQHLISENVKKIAISISIIIFSLVIVSLIICKSYFQKKLLELIALIFSLLLSILFIQKHINFDIINLINRKLKYGLR